MDHFTHVFTPMKIGKMTVKNRIEVSPAVPFLASADYLVTRELIEWTRALARGGAAIVTVGDSSVTSEDARRYNHLNSIDLGTDRVVNGLSMLAETIHRYGAKASIELNLRDSSSPTDLTQERISELIAEYADAAVRCKAAGMDMILVHGGHGHLLGRFFSPIANKRSDKYGGSTTKRMRFAIEVLEAIRNKVGDRLAIEYRISASELTEGSPTVEETIEFAKTIQNTIDLLHVSAGGLHDIGAASQMIQPLYISRGINVHFAERFKNELSVPITTVGSLNMTMAEEIVSSGKADMVAMIRTIIADPDCVDKARKGFEKTIRPCIRCNVCLGSSPTYPLPTRCSVNPVAGREAELLGTSSPKLKKKVVIVGGGPAGMEAARVATERGHQVILCEKDDRLGGTLHKVVGLPFKDDIRRYLEWAVKATLDNPAIDIRLSTKVTETLIKQENPDALIIAIGALPNVPSIPGVAGSNVALVDDVDTGRATIGQNVLVVGAGLTGLETALYLAQIGKQVTVIDMLPLTETSYGVPLLNIGYLWNELKEKGTEIRDMVTLREITGKGAVVTGKDGTRSEILCDTVVLSLGVKHPIEELEGFKGLAPEVHYIGDCVEDRGNIWRATTGGYNAVIDI